MTKFKRELVPGTYLTAADMLSVLSKQHFKAAALRGRIVLAVQPPVAWLLDNCCIGRAAMQSAAPLQVPVGGHSGGGGSNSGGGSDEQLAAAVVGVAGVHTAGPELWQQYIQHQQQVLAQQSRKASRSKRAAAAAAAAAAALQAARAAEVQGEGGGFELVCLVQLSFQEAVFLSHVLRCCSVVSADDPSTQDQQQHWSNGSHVDTATAQAQAQRAGHNSSSSSLTAQQQGREVAAGVPGQPLQQQSNSSAADPTPVTRLLSGSELWQWCCQHTTGGAGVFAPQYAAYHHLRSLGWLPLPGLAYGADYVLYQLHPELAHSDFVVTVMVEGDARQASAPKQVQQASSSVTTTVGQQAPGEMHPHPQQPADRVQGGLDALPSTQLAWLDACIMQRLARQVLKEMMLLYVVVPAGTSLLEFKCIDSFQIREVFLQRWVPSEHRDSGR
jgi:hypothetical protein